MENKPKRNFGPPSIFWRIDEHEEKLKARRPVQFSSVILVNIYTMLTVCQALFYIHFTYIKLEFYTTLWFDFITSVTQARTLMYKEVK